MLERAPCKHPPSTRLRNVGWEWCPWCDRSCIEERAESLLGLIRYTGPVHAWRLAAAMHERRSDVAEALRWLRGRERIDAIGVVRVRHRDGRQVELTLWKARR